VSRAPAEPAPAPDASTRPTLPPVETLLHTRRDRAPCRCATTSDTWGGYTENEAKEILALPTVRNTIIESSIRSEGQVPVAEIYPTEEELQEADLRKVTLTGQEAWEYSDTPNFFCM
jgi:hypothetical protein